MANKLYIGDPENPDFLFEDTRIIDLVINTASDIIGDELSIDTLEAVVENTDKTILDLAYGTEITFVNSSDNISNFYLKSIQRTGPNRYTINAHSLVGMMDNEVFYGDVYTNKPLPDLVEEIIKTDSLQPFRVLEYIRINDYGNFGDLCGDRFPNQHVTMRDSIKIKFRFNGFQAGEDPASSTTWFCTIAGSGNLASNSNQEIVKRIYCLIITVTRSSTSASWPSTGTLAFYYQNQSVVLGTPQIGEIWEIEAIPSQNKLICNGVEYTFTGVSAGNNVETPMNVIGGGCWMYASGGSILGPVDYHDVKHDLYEWKVTSESGEVKIDATPIYNVSNGEVYIRTKPDGEQSNSYCADNTNPAYKSSGTQVPGAIYEGYRQNIIDKITYSTIAANTQINGWLPILSKREALHYVLMSTGIIIKKDDFGNLLFTEPINLSSPIPDSSIYMEGSVDYFQKVNELQVEEHAFISTRPSTLYPSPVDVLYESIVDSDGIIVCVFQSAPAEFDGWATSYDNGYYGMCANAVLLNGISAGGQVMGFLYKHQATLMSRRIGDSPDGGVASITGIPIITAANADNVIDRMAEYYTTAYKTNLNIIKTIEKCGNKYSFTNPFNEEDSGFMSKMSEQVSAISKGDCEFLCGYTGSFIGEGYSNFAILTGSGTWEVPASVFEKDNPQIRVYLIGGGKGGESGYAGENGKVNTSGGIPKGKSQGGDIGKNGTGGKVYSVTISNPSATLSFSCGTGGVGGAICYSHDTNNSGTDGTPTTLTNGETTYTSESGSILENGLVNVFNNEIYAVPFPTSIVAYGHTEFDDTAYPVGVGVGGYGGYLKKDGNTYTYLPSRYCADPFTPEIWLRGEFGGFGSYQGVYGGCGGGAGLGQHGGNGGTSRSGQAGNGGNGGNATVVPTKATDWNPNYYGYGGVGGGGGGAGGNSGIVYGSGSPGTAGTGGYGGKGGTGGDGCVLIYY